MSKKLSFGVLCAVGIASMSSSLAGGKLDCPAGQCSALKAKTVVLKPVTHDTTILSGADHKDTDQNKKTDTPVLGQQQTQHPK